MWRVDRLDLVPPGGWKLLPSWDRDLPHYSFLVLLSGHKLFVLFPSTIMTSKQIESGN